MEPGGLRGHPGTRAPRHGWSPVGRPGGGAGGPAHCSRASQARALCFGFTWHPRDRPSPALARSVQRRPAAPGHRSPGPRGGQREGPAPLRAEKPHSSPAPALGFGVARSSHHLPGSRHCSTAGILAAPGRAPLSPRGSRSEARRDTPDLPWAPAPRLQRVQKQSGFFFFFFLSGDWLCCVFPYLPPSPPSPHFFFFFFSGDMARAVAPGRGTSVGKGRGNRS
ncbi:skin secretory protein xP2-like [Choloepus didactylus]|uniref:skin secretory protein xP2-like n=1 Tax=Choloepus didactylus TaxID=27675 RepID=UPI00189F5C75|nr:skin secretory protein xP2-like [Choloepus didactylus]